MRLTGTTANTYSGTTQVGGAGLAQASIVLAASGGNAISGSLLQLGGGNYTSAGFVSLGAANQINDTATVQLTSGHYSGSSIFSLNGFRRDHRRHQPAQAGRSVDGNFPQRRRVGRYGDTRGIGYVHHRQRRPVDRPLYSRWRGRQTEHGRGADRIRHANLWRRRPSLHGQHHRQQRHAEAMEHLGVGQQHHVERRRAGIAADRGRHRLPRRAPRPARTQIRSAERAGLCAKPATAPSSSAAATPTRVRPVSTPVHCKPARRARSATTLR